MRIWCWQWGHRSGSASQTFEPRMLPGAQQVRPFGRQQPLLDQKRDDPRAEKFLQRRENGLGQQGAEQLHLLLVAGGAEPPALAGERQQVLVLAVVAAHAGEAVGEVPAAHELLDHLRDDRAQEAVLAFVNIGVDLQERVEMRVQAPPKRRGLRVAGAVDLLRHAPQCTTEGVPSNGTGPKKFCGKCTAARHVADRGAADHGVAGPGDERAPDGCLGRGKARPG